MFLLRLALAFVAFVVLVLAVIAGGTLAYTQWLDNRPAPVATSRPAQSVASRRGTFDRYSYELMTQGADAVAVFEPNIALGRDDVIASGVVALAADAVIKDAFMTSLDVSTARQSGDSIVATGANGRTYVIVPVKADSGAALQAVRISQQ